MFITLKKAIDIVLEATNTLNHEEPRNRRKKIDKRLRDAIKQVKIQTQNGQLNFNDFLIHVERWYPDFSGYPSPIRNITLESDVPAPTVSYSMFKLPNDAQALQALVIRQKAEIVRLQAEIAQLKPDAERHREICETNKKNGRGSKKSTFS